MRKTYYKVIVAQTRQSVNSLAGYSQYTSLALKYPIKEWVKPVLEGSKIFVFADRRYAYSFVRNCGTSINCNGVFHDLIVVPCYIKNPSKVEVQIPTTGAVLNRCDFINNFWSAYKKNKKNPKKFFKTMGGITSAPIGTVFCSEVYCLE